MHDLSLIAGDILSSSLGVLAVGDEEPQSQRHVAMLGEVDGAVVFLGHFANQLFEAVEKFGLGVSDNDSLADGYDCNAYGKVLLCHTLLY